jgi:hypothetical protein
MVYFTSIEQTRHYIDNHESDVPWAKVIELILTSKSPRKKGNKFEIEKDEYYVLFEIMNHVLYVINARSSKK